MAFPKMLKLTYRNLLELLGLFYRGAKLTATNNYRLTVRGGVSTL